MYEWLVSGWKDLPLVLFSGAATYLGILFYTRLVGLRSLSKMSAADFAMTVAVGSLFASTIATKSPSLLLGLTALATLYAGQWLLAWSRYRSRWVSHLVDNEPLLLMCRGEILDDNLEQANVTRNDLYGKLREANAFNFDQVLAVVFETTGDISVLHSDDPNARIDPLLLENVLSADRYLTP